MAHQTSSPKKNALERTESTMEIEMPSPATEEIKKKNEELEAQHKSVKRHRQPALPSDHTYKWVLFRDTPDEIIQDIVVEANDHLNLHKKAEQPDTLVESASVQIFPSELVSVKLDAKQKLQRAKLHKDKYRTKPENVEKIKAKAESKKEENKAYAKLPHVVDRKTDRTFCRQQHVKLLKTLYPDIYAKQDAILEKMAVERRLAKRQRSQGEESFSEADESHSEEPPAKKQRVE